MFYMVIAQPAMYIDISNCTIHYMIRNALIIKRAYTIIQPYAMMIEYFYTTIALFAMFGLRFNKTCTLKAVHKSWKLLFNCHNLFFIFPLRLALIQNHHLIRRIASRYNKCKYNLSNCQYAIEDNKNKFKYFISYSFLNN